MVISLTTDSRRMQMYEELHVMSPVVPTREFCFLRYCRQIERGLWAIADISVDLQQHDARFGAPPSRSCRLPSGCLIADMADGSSKVLSLKVHFFCLANCHWHFVCVAAARACARMRGCMHGTESWLA